MYTKPMSTAHLGHADMKTAALIKHIYVCTYI